MMDREWWHPLPESELSDNYTSSTDMWLLDNLGDAGEKLDRLWKERCELNQENQEIRELLRECREYIDEVNPVNDWFKADRADLLHRIKNQLDGDSGE
jgi:hypothetical protein